MLDAFACQSPIMCMTIFRAFAPMPMRNENKANFIRAWTLLMSLSESTEETASIANKAIEMLTPIIHTNYRNAKKNSMHFIYIWWCSNYIKLTWSC